MTTSASSFPSPLKDYQNLDPLPTGTYPASHPDAKSLLNPSSPSSTTPSQTYTTFPGEIHTAPRRAGFDAHIYFFQSDSAQLQYAKELHERVRREFPELRIYPMFEQPVGPHPTGMFEVNLFTPAQMGAFVPWLVVNRGPLSVLVHPNTGDDVWDHTEGAMWLGERMPLLVSLLKEIRR